MATQPQPKQPEQRSEYLDPQILAQIGSLDVVARKVVEGLRIGLHRSPVRGISSEFTAFFNGTFCVNPSSQAIKRSLFNLGNGRPTVRSAQHSGSSMGF